MHLQKETNYHTMPRFYETKFFGTFVSWYLILSPVCTILPPVSVPAHLSLNTYDLSGRTYANTWGEDMRNRFLQAVCFWSPFGRVSTTCSQWFRQKQCVRLNSRARVWCLVWCFKVIKSHSLSLHQHHKPYCQCYVERGNHVLVEIPSFSLGQRRVCSKEKTSGSALQTHYVAEQTAASVLDKEK